MKREKSLFKNTLIITIGKICTQLISFFLLPLYTGVLSTAEYGTVDLINTLCALLLPIITFQVEQAVFRELIEVRNDEEKVKTITSSSIISVIIQCLIFVGIFAIISPYIKSQYKILLVLNVVVYIFGSLFLQIARGYGENGKYAIASFISAIVSILCNVIFLVVLKIGVVGMLTAGVIGQLCSIIFLCFALKIKKYFSFKSLDQKCIQKLWKYSIPLIPNTISWWVFNASDRVIVSALLGMSFTGVLSAANKFSAVYITFYNIFNMSWTESISLCIKDRDIDLYFNKMFNIMVRLFCSLAIGIIGCMPFVYPILINAKFNDGYVLIPILIVASFFHVIVGLLSVIYIANMATKDVAKTSIIAAIINLVVNLCLLKFIGLYAAAISTFVAFFVMSIYRIVDIRKKYFSVKFDKDFLFITIPFLTIVLILFYINNFIGNIFNLVLVVLYAIIINKKTFRDVLKLVKGKFSKTRI